jgi:hypothetical protein
MKRVFMKRVVILAALSASALMVTTRANADDPDQWFYTGERWYEQPCGLEAFAKYGRTTEPSQQVRDAYFATIKDPKLCSKLFP